MHPKGTLCAGILAAAVLFAGSPAPHLTTRLALRQASPHACAAAASRVPPGAPASVAAVTDVNGCAGYWIATSNGSVAAFQAPAYGDVSANPPGRVVGIAATPGGGGYWLVTSNGVVNAFGDALAHGDMRSFRLNGAIVAMATTPDGGGYWLLGSDGGIFSFGDAQFFGSTGSLKLNQPIVGIASAPMGTGYWLVASDGGVFAFGSAMFRGSMGSTRLNKPVVGLTSDPSGDGYRMVATDGGIFSFGAPFFGSLGSNPPPVPVVTMAPSTDGNGYYMVGAHGAVYAFGDAPYLGGFSSPVPGAAIVFTSVPPIGSTSHLVGQVANVDPRLYRVVVFIQVGAWWVKPSWANPLTPIAAGGAWACDIVTGGEDANATALEAFVVPSGLALPSEPGVADVQPYSVAYAYASRT